jgi:hypothetical protein
MKGIGRHLRFHSKSAAVGFNAGRLPNGVGLACVEEGSGPFYGAGVLVNTSLINGRNPPNPMGTASSYILGKLAFKVGNRICNH